MDMRAVFDGDHGRGQQGDETLLVSGDGENFCECNSECAARFHHSATGDNQLAGRGCEEINFEFGGQHATIGLHQAEGGISGGTIGNRANRAAMDEAVLLGIIRVRLKHDFG